MDRRGKKELGRNTGKTLRRLYVLALSAVAALTIFGQLFIQSSIHAHQSDSHVINLAGSQRYLSQQIVKYCVFINENVSNHIYPNKAEKLNMYLNKWRQGHHGLQFGDTALNLPGDNSKTILEMFQHIDPYFRNMVHSADTIIKLAADPVANKALIDLHVNKVLVNEGSFFKGMDDIVHQYDKEAKAKISFLKTVEYILLALTLIILLLEGMFIFRPVANKIKETIAELAESEHRANVLADRLKLSNIQLKKLLKDLEDVNFALDKATILAKTDRYGIITYVNDKFCEILHYTEKELLGQRFNMISSHYHSKAFFDEMWEVISDGNVWNNEIQNQTKDGSYVWLDATIVPVLDAGGTPESYIGIYTDVTARFRQSINEQKIKSASVLEGQEIERKNIARELHDGLGQMLTALKFNFEGITGRSDGKEQEKIMHIRKQIMDTIQETRRISFSLMPNVLNDYGLLPAIKHLIDQVSKHSNINIILETDWDNQRLSRQIEINLYRILQEAINNAVKYAEADEIDVFVDKMEGSLRLEVSDNGKGFSPSNIDKSKVAGSGNGITNIQERTDLINGDFRIQSAPGKGTKIVIKIPLV